MAFRGARLNGTRNTSAHCLAAVSGSDASMAIALDMLEEVQQHPLRKILRPECRYSTFQSLCYKTKEQSPRVAVSQDGPVRGVPLLHKPFVEEQVKQPGKRRKSRFSH
jgi:hypothetical protein